MLRAVIARPLRSSHATAKPAVPQIATPTLAPRNGAAATTTKTAPTTAIPHRRIMSLAARVRPLVEQQRDADERRAERDRRSLVAHAVVARAQQRRVADQAQDRERRADELLGDERERGEQAVPQPGRAAAGFAEETNATTTSTATVVRERGEHDRRRRRRRHQQEREPARRGQCENEQAGPP